MKEIIKEESNGIILIKCPWMLDGDALLRFSSQAKSWLLSSSATLVLDMADVQGIGRAFYPIVIQMRTTLKRDSKSLYTINLLPSLARQLSNDGMEHIFEPVKSMDDIMKKAPATPAKSGLDAEIVNPFLLSTLKTFQIQCKTEAKPLKPYLKTHALPDIAIAGVITMSSPSYTGSVVLAFPEKVFLKVYENMFDEKLNGISAEAQDAAGELLNIIYGMVKTELNQKGHEFQKALPTVLVGEGLTIRQSGNRPAVVVPFETSHGQFHIEFEINKGA